LAHYCGDSAISRIVIIKSLAHDAEKAILARISDADLAMHRCWAQVNENAIGLENAMSFVKGMNHTLMSHSSQHPREYDQVERLLGVF
jgi:hypothetical protein